MAHRYKVNKTANAAKASSIARYGVQEYMSTDSIRAQVMLSRQDGQTGASGGVKLR